MALDTLTWTKSTEQSIPCAGATVTYAEFLDKMKALIDASTHWNATVTNDTGNNRGYIELSPRSAGVTGGGKLLYAMANTAVAGSAGSERPLQANRLAPWAAATSTLACTRWVGFAVGAGSVTPSDPWGATVPTYASPAAWSKFVACGTVVPPASQAMAIIESAEAICVYWTHAANQIAGFVFGKIVETPDGASADWGMILLGASGDATNSAGGWTSIPNTNTSPPLATAGMQHSGGSSVRAPGLMLKADGSTYGFGRTSFATLTANDSGAGYSNSSEALLQAIVVAGGLYFSGSSDLLIGVLRQMRWGPPALRAATGYSNGVKIGVHLNFHASTQQLGGLWFHDQR